jgi:hypothetical protein
LLVLFSRPGLRPSGVNKGKKMNKKILVAFLLFVIVNLIFAFDFNKDDFCANYLIGEYIIATNNRLIHLSEEYGKRKILSEIQRPNQIVNKYGYAYIKMPTAECYLIELGGLIIPVKKDYERNYSDWNESFEVPSNIRASSEYTENINGNTIVYDSRNPFNRLDYQIDAGFLFGYYKLPWIPDLKHDKVPYLQFTVKHETEYIAILLGYIDFDKPNLFLENARPRKISVIDMKNNKNIGDYFLDDGIKYNIIKLNYKVREIEIIFSDYYMGIKYKDPCVSSIVVLESDITSDYGKSMLEYFKEILDRR